MKKIILSLSLFVSHSFGFSVSSHYNVNPQGAYYKEINIQCAAGEESQCQEICQNDLTCTRIEPYCLNCAGTTSLLLRTLFTQISEAYKATSNELPIGDLIQYLGHEKYILLGASSVYNFYRPVNSPDLIQGLLALCPAGDEEALLAVSLDEENEPAKLSFVLCKAVDGTSKAFQVELNHPDLGEKPLQMEMKWNLNLGKNLR